MTGEYTVPASGIILDTAASIIINCCETTLLIVHTRNGDCLSEATSPIIFIMSCNTRVAV